MVLITEIALTLFAGIALIFYASDTLFWIYKEEKEQEEEAQKQEEDEKAEEIRKQIAETLYS